MAGPRAGRHDVRAMRTTPAAPLRRVRRCLSWRRAHRWRDTAARPARRWLVDWPYWIVSASASRTPTRKDSPRPRAALLATALIEAGIEDHHEVEVRNHSDPCATVAPAKGAVLRPKNHRLKPVLPLEIGILK